MLALNNTRQRLSDSYMRINFPLFIVGYKPIPSFFPRGIQTVCERLPLKKKLPPPNPPSDF